MEGWYQWVVLLHVVAAFTFALARGRGWIWAAIVLLVLLFALMYARASSWFAEVRRAAGQAYYVIGKGPQSAEPPDAARLVTLTASARPMEIAAIGYGGLVVILWLMVMKPF